ncbi:hypothetical protein AAF712_012651 [Marasmius tenuissimus]|uniref:Uncharacterized protein n=1 Tax=Marasmius tenuissimus TaxID=585030 RepID=A0ABR2ZGT7_9AGAR
MLRSYGLPRLNKSDLFDTSLSQDESQELISLNNHKVSVGVVIACATLRRRIVSTLELDFVWFLNTVLMPTNTVAIPNELAGAAGLP